MLLTSFGYLHQPTDEAGRRIPPAADYIEDVRAQLRDPAAARDILDLDGRDPRVQAVVLATPGALDLLTMLSRHAQLAPARPRRIAIGCAGGRHRSVALVELLARECDTPVVVEHLHVHLPRITR